MFRSYLFSTTENINKRQYYKNNYIFSFSIVGREFYLQWRGKFRQDSLTKMTGVVELEELSFAPVNKYSCKTRTLYMLFKFSFKFSCQLCWHQHLPNVKASTLFKHDFRNLFIFYVSFFFSIIVKVKTFQV